MSILSRPRVADALARLFAATVDPAPAAEVRFGYLAAPTEAVRIPTRFGPIPATVYLPPSRVPRPPVYVNVHGGGFVVGHPEQDDPWCRYLAARANVAVVNPERRHRRSGRPRHGPQGDVLTAQRNPMWVVALSWDCGDRAAGR